MIALVVAGTSHTLVTRLPGLEGAGTRVHTMPDPLATSTTATRSTNCSYSSSSSSRGSRIAGPSPPITVGQMQGCPGASVGSRNSDRRAPSTVRDPSRSRPRPQTNLRAHGPETTPASAGNPARFSRLRDAPAGTPGLTLDVAELVKLEGTAVRAGDVQPCLDLLDNRGDRVLAERIG